jgi:hypothetical protein
VHDGNDSREKGKEKPSLYHLTATSFDWIYRIEPIEHKQIRQESWQKVRAIRLLPVSDLCASGA